MRVHQKRYGRAERPSSSSCVEKPLEELTNADIMQLTREDCRRYLKERGMRRPSWNKFQAIQQVLSLKGLFYSKGIGEKEVPKEDSLQKECTQVISDNVMPSFLKGESNGPLSQGVIGGMKEVHSFSGSAKGGFVFPTSQRKGLPDDGQPQLPTCMDAKFESPRSSQAFASSLPNSNTTLSLPPTQGKGLLSTNYGGFGSPLPVFLASNCLAGSRLSAAQNTAASNVQERSPIQGTQTFSESGARCRLNPVHLRQPTSQLTIFYAGFVNVYDDVPADKAQAVMLLAGSKNQWASSTGHSPAGTDHPMSVPALGAPARGCCSENASPSIPAAIYQPCVTHSNAELSKSSRKGEYAANVNLS